MILSLVFLLLAANACHAQETVAISGNSTNATEKCLENSSDDFPDDLFTEEQRKNGAIILHFILGTYCFMLVSIICNDYFLPSIECICQVLRLPQDIAAATFMAFATTAPEIFVNIIGTFITETDLGLGTMTGSSLFNTLGVAAIGGIAAPKAVKIKRWPLTRDSVIYFVAISGIVIVTLDNVVHWSEALALVSLYLFYLMCMLISKPVMRYLLKKRSGEIDLAKNHRIQKQQSQKYRYSKTRPYTIFVVQPMDETMDETRNKFSEPRLVKNNTEVSNAYIWSMRVWRVVSFPPKLLLRLTVPNCTTYPRLFPLTFVMCILWIASNSYLVSWMITVIGRTYGIADSVMGLTFLAAGSCIPEAVSLVIMSRKGEGGMGVSNSLGANTLDALIGLAVPWLVKGLTHGPVAIRSSHPIKTLPVAVLALYGALCLFKYHIGRKSGIILLILYASFLITAIFLETDVLADGRAEPSCPHHVH